MGNNSDPIEVVAAARRWIGTPYVDGQALRGVGCDCIGLIRGVLLDVSGIKAPNPPGWRADWASSRARPLVTAARDQLSAGDRLNPQPGDVLALRGLNGREPHCGIMAPDGRFIHAIEGVGVVEVHLSQWVTRVSFVAKFPAAV